MKIFSKVVLKVILLIVGTQMLFWLSLFLFPETNSRNLGQEIGYRFIDEKIKSASNDTYKYLIAGDSTAATAIHPKVLRMNSLTLGVWGSSPAEVYFYVSKYLDSHPAPKCFLYSQLIAPDYYKAHSFWDFVITYSDLPLSFISEIYDKSKELGSFPGNSYSKISFYTKYFLIKYKFFFYAQNIYEDKLKYAFNKKNAYAKSWHLINAFNGVYVKKATGPGTRGDWWTFLAEPLKLDPYYDYYLDKLFSLIESKGIKLFTFSPPVSLEIYQKYQERLVETANYLNEKSSHYKNAKYINMKEYYPAEYYIDQAHLNMLGSKEFTRKFVRQIDCD